MKLKSQIKYIKSIICMCLVIVLSATLTLGFSVIPVKAESGSKAINEFTAIYNIEKFDERDVLITVSRHVYAEPNKKELPTPTLIFPLYNLDEVIIAYDITMSDGSYMIVNANRENPIVLEFGGRDSLKNITTRKYYLAPFAIAERSIKNSSHFILPSGTIIEDSEKLKTVESELKAFLEKPNYDAASEHAIIKVALNRYYQSQSADDIDRNAEYGLTPKDVMPANPYTEEYIAGFTANAGPYGFFADMGEYQELPGVKNHCAAVSALNMVLYYRYRLGYIKASASERENLFIDIHLFMGNGPVLAAGYRNRLQLYVESFTTFQSHAYPVDKTWSSYQNIVLSNRMSAVFLWPSLFSAHFVNGVGWRTYTNVNYCALISNWARGHLVFGVFGVYLSDLALIDIF